MNVYKILSYENILEPIQSLSHVHKYSNTKSKFVNYFGRPLHASRVESLLHTASLHNIVYTCTGYTSLSPHTSATTHVSSKEYHNNLRRKEDMSSYQNDTKKTDSHLYLPSTAQVLKCLDQTKPRLMQAQRDLLATHFWIKEITTSLFYYLAYKLNLPLAALFADICRWAGTCRHICK